jgi:transposase
VKTYIVRLTQEQRHDLHRLISTGAEAARKVLHARILLKADAGEQGPGWTDEQISAALEVRTSTLVRVRRTFAEQGLHAALQRRSFSRTRPRRLDGEQEAHVIALACSAPPDGRDHWSLRLLASRLVTLEVVEEVSHETVRPVLKKTRLLSLAKAALVHPSRSQCRLCLCDGGHAGRVYPARRSEPSAGLHGRGQHPTAGCYQPTLAG